jgi:O-antigen/teichoic acid export membrane protein
MKKNISYTFITFGTRAFTNIILFFILARVWGVNQFGTFMFSYTLSNLLVIILDYGYSLNLVKIIANKRKKVRDYTRAALYSKNILFILVLTISCILYFFYPGFNSLDSMVVFITLLIAAILNSYAIFFNLPLRAFEYFKEESLLSLITNLFNGIFVVVLLLYEIDSLLNISLAFLLSKIIYFVLSVWTYKYKFNSYSLGNEDPVTPKKMIVEGIPYAIHVIVGTLYFQVDTIIVQLFEGEFGVGQYQAAMRVFVGGLLISDVLNSVYLSRLSRVMANKEDFKKYALQLNFISISIGLMIGSFIFFFSDTIVYLLYGKAYDSVSGVLKLFAISLFLRYTGAMYGVLLTISNRQKVRSAAVTFALILNMALNTFLIPIYHLYGAAIAGIITVLFLNLTYVYFIYKEYKSLFIFPLITQLKVEE